MEDAKTIEVRANGLRFTAYEQGQGPLVLCLHGFPDHARSFRHQMGPLCEAGYRVVVPYMRGYAPTEIPADGSYQGATLAHDALALIEALGEDRAVLVGHDWGALAAYGAAVLAPERVGRLVVAAVPYGPAFLNAFTSVYAQLKRSWYMFFFQSPLAETALGNDDYAFVRNLWLDWSPGWDFPEDEMDRLRETFAKPGGGEAAISYYRCIFDPARQRPELANDQMMIGMSPINVPTLYAHGKTDGCLGLDLVVGMEEMFPAGLETVFIEGAGHFLHQEKPEEFNRAMLEFLAKG